MIESIIKKYKLLFKHYPLIKRSGIFLRKSLTGFTLLELLVSVVILSFLTLCIFAVLNIGDMSWRTDMGILDIVQQLRQSMPGMIREIRHGINNSTHPVNITNNGTRIKFYIHNITNATNFVSYYMQNDRIIREHPSGTTRVLATNIKGLDFCCYHGSSICNTTCHATATGYSKVVEIKITAGRTVKLREMLFNLTEKVKLRNE